MGTLMEKYPGQLPDHFRLECGKGWEPLVATVLQLSGDRARSLGIEPPILSQAGEKLGTLRLKCHTDDLVIEAYLDMAFALSARTCEVCGAPGKAVYAKGWQRTRCAEHIDEETNWYQAGE